MSEATKLLTAGEVAERWGVNEAHVYRLTRERRVPAVQLGRYYRYRLAALEDFEENGGTATGQLSNGKDRP